MKKEKASTVPTSKNSASSTEFEPRTDLSENDEPRRAEKVVPFQLLCHHSDENDFDWWKIWNPILAMIGIAFILFWLILAATLVLTFFENP